MVSCSGRFVIAYNGEVYNADELRCELSASGLSFRGHSDTEVILEAAAAWGVEAAIPRLIGMFALTLWDRRERTLYLVRDRLGIKPMYWAEFDDCFIFGSELKALRAEDSWSASLDLTSLASYMRFGYVPTPRTIYTGVHKLEPGKILKLRCGQRPEFVRYWSLEEVACQGQATRYSGTEEEATEALDQLLRDAVKRRMIADVPLGAFLSGGIDSSTVVAMMQVQNPRPVRTYSIGFREAEYNEGQHAATVAKHLGTEHTDLYVSPNDALDVIPQLADMYDEPFADSSQIPTYLVSKLTRQHVTVALSGDGGDELFAGYTRYFRQSGLWQTIDVTPQPLRAITACGLRALSPATWSALGGLIPKRRRPGQFGDKMHKLANVLAGEPEASAFYRQVISLWVDPGRVLTRGEEVSGPLGDSNIRNIIPDFVERMQYLDTITYLPDDILTKVDRASMAVSLEARVPLLDHRVVAFSWSLPPSMKAGNGSGKRLLRRVLDRYVPQHLVDRPKKGFTMPIQDWLRNELRDWAENLLSEPRLCADGIFEPTLIRQRWREHIGRTHDWHSPLWAVLMFQAWKERWLA
jgi:asparagine synthase (glutamine-hydrolysing)